jgi:hypothetical protein
MVCVGRFDTRLQPKLNLNSCLSELMQWMFYDAVTSAETIYRPAAVPMKEHDLGEMRKEVAVVYFNAPAFARKD